MRRSTDMGRRRRGWPRWGPLPRTSLPPAPQKFFIDDDATGIRLTGTPDGILVRADGRKVIVDYKTAKHTEAQDELRPIYEVQLNGYARIAEARGLGPVDRLALVYTEPITDGPPGLFESARTEEGFVMGFRATLEDVPLDPDLLPPLMRRAREIYDAPRPPRRSPGCEDCDRFAQLSLAAQDWP
ncbi:MAG: PD-(D/E)XK nuclease family protein [Candidatus Thermoplasmatota archaeon]|nr:PD-(D/E)XK nuclease family protein [Candidatus Thermoplasmatota archaeon]